MTPDELRTAGANLREFVEMRGGKWDASMFDALGRDVAHLLPDEDEDEDEDEDDGEIMLAKALIDALDNGADMPDLPDEDEDEE